MFQNKFAKPLFSGLKLWLSWIFVSGVGMAVIGSLFYISFVLLFGGLGVFQFKDGIYFSKVLTITIVFGLAVLIGGLCLGFLQGLVIRPYLRQSKQWVIATMIGCIIWSFIAFSPITVIPETASIITYDFLIESSFLISFFIVGLSQWVVLKREIPRSYYWLIAFMMGCLVSVLIMYMLWNYALNDQFILIIGVITLWMISGIGLVYLFSQNEFRKKNYHCFIWN